MKKIINKPIQTKNENLICKKCESNCHKNCNCHFTVLHKWFCNMISFNGNCKICKHSISEHEKGKKLYIKNEENEILIHNDFDELENYIKFLSNKKKEEMINLNLINDNNELLDKTIDYFNKKINSINNGIEKAKIQNKSIEKELIEILNNIKNNLEFLEKNALNKEKRTIKTFIEEYAKSKNNREKELIENLYQKFINSDKKNIFEK